MNYTYDGYIIRKQSEEIQQKIKNDLTIKVNDYNYDKSISFEIFQREEDIYKIPKFWGFKFIENLPILKLRDENKINIEFKGEIRDNQKKILDEIIPSLSRIGGGILSIPCGEGKTIIAIKLIQHLGLRTLFIVNTSVLMKQTKDRIEQFTNARVGVIRRNKIDIDNKDIVIGMLHSLALKDYHPSIFNIFDLLIVDEVHCIATRYLVKYY